MDARRFDALAKTLSGTGTRRRIVRLVTALPLGVTLTTLLRDRPDATAEDDDHGSSHRHHRRKARHRHQTGNNKENRKGKRKGTGKDKKNGNRGCTQAGKAPTKGRPCCAGLERDAAGQCVQSLTPPPPTCGTGEPCLVFVTSEAFLGNLEGAGGLAAADAICQRLAKNRPDPLPPLPGTYKAWLSTVTGTDSVSPSTRFVRSPGPYKRVDGVTVASSWTDLTTQKPDGSYLAAAITVAETGDDIVNDEVWTFTRSDGTAGHSSGVELDCDNWSNATSGFGGSFGHAFETTTNSGWTGDGASTCDGPLSDTKRLYCFQQS